MSIQELLWSSPQVQALKNASEKNKFHGGRGEENVFIHTERVYDAAIAIATGERPLFLNPQQQDVLREFFTPGRIATQGQLAILHDIGKGHSDGIQIKADGTTGSAGHEKLSGEMMPEVYEYLENKGISLPDETREQLTKIIAHHGDAYPLILFNEPQAETPGQTLTGHMDAVFDSTGVTATEDRIYILVNALGDFAAGRIVTEQYKGEVFGFQEEHKQRAKDLIEYYLIRV